MLRKTEEYMKQQHMAEPGERIVLGLSGGMDSVCLFHILRMLGYSLEAVHVNHGIRGEEADRDEAFAKMLCDRYEVPFHKFYFDVPAISREKHMTAEEAGRMVRRQAFARVMEKTKAGRIALAHHGNDRAETFLFHLSRGTGIKGLSAMKPVEGCYIRPLMWAGRAEIEQYVKKEAYDFVEDGTNALLYYTRNKVRHQIVPLLEEINPQSIAHICGAAEKISAVAEFIDKEAEKLCRLSAVMDSEEVRVKKSVFEQGDAVLQIPVLQKCLEYLTGSRANITEEHLRGLLKLFEMQTGKEISLPYRLCGVRTYEGIKICVKKEKEELPLVEIIEEGAYDFDGVTFGVTVEEWEEEKRIPIKTYTKCFDYDKISQRVCFRTRRSGDYLEINREGGKKALQDYLVNEKIPKDQRDRTILLADGSHILWVVGKRISEYYKVTNETKRILKVQMYGGTEHEL